MPSCARASFTRASAICRSRFSRSAVRTDSDTARVYVVSPTGSAEERIVITGQTVGDLIEITNGVKAGDVVATSNIAQLADGVRITGTR